jgi:hypothetical protein
MTRIISAAALLFIAACVPIAPAVTPAPPPVMICPPTPPAGYICAPPAPSALCKWAPTITALDGNPLIVKFLGANADAAIADLADAAKRLSCPPPGTP